MSRPLRIQYPNAVYHITCRGNERQNIFKDNADRQKFLQFLIQSLNIYTVKIHSYVLMNNHFHLLLETPLANLSEFMRKFNITYTSYYNRQHNRTGHLYQGRYKSILVDKDEYLSILSRYIHLNPVRVKPNEKASVKEKIRIIMQYPWSSLPSYLNKRKKEEFIDYSLVLSEYGGDNNHARKAYCKALYEDLVAGMKIHDKILGQSILGGDEFVEWVTDEFIKGEKDREQPSLKKIHTYKAKDAILKTLEKETGKSIKAIAKEKGIYRQIAMELLYRLGGLKGEEIGEIMGVGYTSVSQERRRLLGRLSKDQKLETLFNRIMHKCND